MTPRTSKPPVGAIESGTTLLVSITVQETASSLPRTIVEWRALVRFVVNCEPLPTSATGQGPGSESTLAVAAKKKETSSSCSLTVVLFPDRNRCYSDMTGRQVEYSTPCFVRSR